MVKLLSHADTSSGAATDVCRECELGGMKRKLEPKIPISTGLGKIIW
ncbi:hypothetical protein [Sporomusa sp. KB1]|nr:hypothetical protein [Sporomusa sp. KB1]